jgi:hypothetical protein
MLSNFQVMTSVWSPERVTAGLAASVKTMFVVPHDATFAAQVATPTYVWASVPMTPVPLVNVAAAQETSATTHVGVAATDGAKTGPLPLTMMCSVLEAFARTMLVAETVTADDAVGTRMFVTLKLTVDGTEKLACSLTVAVSVDVPVSFGKGRTVCADSSRAVARVIATNTDTRTKGFPTLLSVKFQEPAVAVWEL